MRRRKEKLREPVMSSTMRLNDDNDGLIYEKEIFSCTQRAIRRSKNFESDCRKGGNQNQIKHNDTLIELNSEIERAFEKSENKFEDNTKENINPNQVLNKTPVKFEKTPKQISKKNFVGKENQTKIKSPILLEKSKCSSITDHSFQLKTKQKEDLSVHHAKANHTILKLQKEIEELKKEKKQREKEFRRSRCEIDGVKGNLRENMERLKELREGIKYENEQREECVQRKIVY